MQELKNKVVDFFMNRVLANAPAWFLVWLYEYRLAKAKPKLDALRDWWNELSRENFMLCADAHYPCRPKRPVIIMMAGLPQTGKSLIAQEFARYGFFHINTNDIRSQLFDLAKKFDWKVPYEYDQTIALYYAKSALLMGYNVVIDSDHMLPLKRKMTEVVLSQVVSRGILVFKRFLVDAPVGFSSIVSDNVSNDHLSNELYHNAVRLRYPTLENNDPPRFKEEVELCILNEFDRQELGHAKYRKLFSPHYVVPERRNLEYVPGWVEDVLSEIISEVNSK